MMSDADYRRSILAGVSRETGELLDAFVALVQEERHRQNLISATSADHIWQRHVLDSAQLIDLGCRDGIWVDVGTGAGFPGIIVGLLRAAPTILTEPRARRAEFLTLAVDRLAIRDRVSVLCSRVEAVSLPSPATTISARAVAALPALFEMTVHLAGDHCLWVLPKGRSAAQDVAATRESWHGEFTLVPSLSDPDAAIVTARNVARRHRR